MNRWANTPRCGILAGLDETQNIPSCTVRRVAASEATTILLEGENGVGKDLIAKTLSAIWGAE